MSAMFKMKKKVKYINIFLCFVVALQAVSFFSAAADTKKAGQSTVIVSLGDSFSSGEGIEPFYGQNASAAEKVRNQDWLAHRSENSWPGRLTLPAVSGTMAENRDANWFFVATSGAETIHMHDRFKKNYDFSGEEGSAYIDAQLDVFDKLGDKKADYVTFTLGGNDAKFTDVVKDAALATINPSALTDRLNAVWRDFYKEDGIRDKLRQSYTDIANAAGPQAKIIVAGYPKLLDKEGKGVLFTKDAAALVNDSVCRFNDEIESLVNSCKASGIKICFVSVEDAFDGHEAYSDDAYIHKVLLQRQAQDIQKGISSYSMHPNEKGAQAYAKCVQQKINEIEKDGGKSEWPTMTGSEERDVVLVLDASGSMDGTPIEETKEASEKFTNTILYEDVGIGIVTYDNDALTISGFSQNETYLKNVIQNINSGGGTDIEAGLLDAHELLKASNAKKKFIVLMSDGAPNDGKVSDDLIAYADSLKAEGIRIYTLGFFSSLSTKTNEQMLMEKIASEGCHYEVDDAGQLVFFFDDIADQIRGTKYYYIRIACPVDVTVKSGGEALSSKNVTGTQRTTFGTLTFEENPEQSDASADNRIKVLRLKEGTNYDIKIEGNGKGRMTYTIGFMNDEGEYSDLRKFSNIKISKKTEIDTVASNAATTTLHVDEDGDGRYDYSYRATENGRGKRIDYTAILGIVLAPIGLLILIIIFTVIVRKRRKKM